MSKVLPSIRPKHSLPLESLSPEDFERLCFWLVRREGFERVEYLGQAGSDQARDIIAQRHRRRFMFQCKRVRQFGPKAVEMEIDRLMELLADERPDEFVFVVTRQMSAKARQRARDLWGQTTCHFWTGAELEERIRRHPDLLKEFFLPDVSSSTLEEVLVPGNLELPARFSPGRLMTAAYEIVPFEASGREADLAALSRWCESPQRRSVFLLTGEGGVGKTRLLIEWCRRIRQRGWHSGFLKTDAPLESFEAIFENGAARLVVVDYAETRLNVIKPILRRMASEPGDKGPFLRLALLARRASEWWEGLLREESGVSDLLLSSPEPRQLRGSFRDEASRAEAFAKAGGRFSEMIAGRATEDGTPTDFLASFERHLFVHMAALAAIEGETIQSTSLHSTLEQERRFWRREVDDLDLDSATSEVLTEALDAAVVAVTLAGGVGGEKAAEETIALATEPWSLSLENLNVLKKLLRRLYAGPTGRWYLERLEPDLLGEELVAEHLQRDTSLPRRMLDSNDDRYSHATLTVLARLAQSRPEAEAWLLAALVGRLEQLAEVALQVAVETGDPAGLVIARALEKEDRLPVAELLMKNCDESAFRSSVPLRELAVVATERVLKHRKDSWEEPSEEQLSELARLARNLGMRLRDLGRYEAALSASREAVNNYRLLARKSPEAPLHDLAESLSDLSLSLSELGRREEALDVAWEAVEFYRQLAEKRPDTFTPGLATSLNNLGLMLRSLSRWEEALEATQEALNLRRQLASDRPDAFNSELATSLNDVASDLRTLGQLENAQVASRAALDLYRVLATDRPDVYLPDLARSLNNHGNALSDLGRREEALVTTQEAVEHYRNLAEKRPSAFNPELARSINNLGNMLRSLGRLNEALLATQEALHLYRQLVVGRPYVFTPELARSLNDLGNTARDLGRNEEALLATQEALDLYRQMATDNPGTFLPDLAGSLNNVGNALSTLGRHEEALEATQRALEKYRQLVAERPHVFSPDLAGNLNNLSGMLSALGQREEALKAAHESVELFRQLATDRSDVFTPELAVSLNNMGTRLRELDCREEAFAAVGEAIRLLRPFFLRLPSAFASLMGAMANNYRTCAKEAGVSADEGLLSPIGAVLEELQAGRPA